MNTQSGEDDLSVGYGVSILPIVSYSSALIVDAESSETALKSAIYRQFLSPGFCAGILLEFPIGSYFSILFGGEYQLHLSEFESDTEEIWTYYINGISVPLLLKVRWYRSYWMPYLHIGLDFSYLFINSYFTPTSPPGVAKEFDNVSPYRLGINFGLGDEHQV